MVSPDELGHVGDAAVTEAERMELDMLVTAASKLVAQRDTLGVDISRQAAELKAELNSYVGKHYKDAARAAQVEVSRIITKDASNECGHVGASESQTASVTAASAKRAASAASKASAQVASAASNMSQSARTLYVQETTRAATLARSGVMTKAEAVRSAVSRMAAHGLDAYTYTKADGTTVRVPVDVGVRRIVQDAAKEAMDAQTLDIADKLGIELVEVSSHGGARPSHAKWQGKVYKLGGESDYPDFWRECKAKGGAWYDPVDGFHGYNCRHTMGLYVEGASRRWNDEPSIPGGHSNDEVYALRQRQRAYENGIRRLKRQKNVLEATGQDAGEVNRRLYQARAGLRQLISDNGEVLSRERWREQVANTASPKASAAGGAARPAAARKQANPVAERLRGNGIAYNEVKELERPLSPEQAIAKLGGKDLTKGSCSSLAFAYAGNRNGLSVTDFRGGRSCDFFARTGNILDIAQLPGVKSWVVKAGNDIKAVQELLGNHVVAGKEYYLATGEHAAIVRLNSRGHAEYLELQDRNGDQGFKSLSVSVLKRRFKCQKSHIAVGLKYEVSNVLIDIDSLKGDEFRRILGYINTE